MAAAGRLPPIFKPSRVAAEAAIEQREFGAGRTHRVLKSNIRAFVSQRKKRRASRGERFFLRIGLLSFAGGGRFRFYIIIVALYVRSHGTEQNLSPYYVVKFGIGSQSVNAF